MVYSLSVSLILHAINESSGRTADRRARASQRAYSPVASRDNNYIMREKWMTKGLLRSSLNLHKLRRKMTGKCNADDMSQNYRSFRNLYNRLIRITKAKYFSELIEIYRNNIFKTRGVLKSIIGTNNDKTNCRIFKIDGAFTDDGREVSQSFCSYFTNIGQQCATSIHQLNGLRHF